MTSPTVQSFLPALMAIISAHRSLSRVVPSGRGISQHLASLLGGGSIGLETSKAPFLNLRPRVTGSHEPVVDPLVVVTYTLTEVIQGMAMEMFEDNVTVWKEYMCNYSVEYLEYIQAHGAKELVK